MQIFEINQWKKQVIMLAFFLLNSKVNKYFYFLHYCLFLLNISVAHCLPHGEIDWQLSLYREKKFSLWFWKWDSSGLLHVSKFGECLQVSSTKSSTSCLPKNRRQIFFISNYLFPNRMFQVLVHFFLPGHVTFSRK